MSANPGITPAEVRQWLVGRISDYLSVPAGELDVHAPLAELGLDSVYALALSGDIEDAFAIAVEPTLAWDYPTIDRLAGGIVEVVRTTAAS
ncbi:acyl carrier protein [Micromonospora sp. R77]|uniref:acyl carrier protein n=1 Tax=Micromonospora sp. R77 TaxID=2925836 RepID=UPI001F60D66C|nr:acyl carrier protein [Micromonospora sp. R77]MCI4065576.1 acyl carrier protein [Micromonospora sp. R77]